MLGRFTAGPFARRFSSFVCLVLLLLGCRGDEPSSTQRGATRVARTTQALAFATNALAYWSFDGAATDAVGGYDLGLAGGAGYAGGIFGQALALPNDATKYASRPGDDAAFDFGASDFTVQVWARFDDTAGQQALIEKLVGPLGPGWSLEKLANQSLQFHAAPTVVVTSAPIAFQANTWNQIVVRRTGSLFEILRNGLVVASASGADPVPDTASPLLVGRRDGLELNPVNGRLDEVAVFGRALSDTEVGNLWNGGMGRRVATGVTVSPAATNVSPRGTAQFTAAGGIGTATTYTWSLQTNASGGNIVAETGAYTAGATPNVVDVLLATDAAGNTATANVNVGAGVSISPGAPASITPQGTLQLTATGGTGPYTWSLPTNASGGTVSAAGLYKAGTTGSVTDTVRATDALGNVAEVNVPVGAGLAISPAAPTVAPRQSVTFLATGGSGSGLVWTLAQNESGATLAGSVYKAGNTGSKTDRVRVTDSLGNTTTTDITVGPVLAVTPKTSTSPPKGSVQFSITGGSGTVASWTIPTNNSGGTIDAAGVYKAGPTGGVTDTVRATDSLGATANATVTVGASVSVTPAAPTVAPRGPIAFSATGGSGTGWVWSLATNSSGATIDAATGAYTAGSTGSKTDVVRVTDSLGNVKDVNVTVGAGVSIAPATPAAPPLGTVQLTATGGSSVGYTWLVTSNASGSSINASGLFAAGPTGNVSDTVQVTDSFGNTASVSVSVGGGISVNPAAPNTPPRGSVAFVVTGGSGMGYQWSFVTNASGGTIAAGTGAYKAGATGNVTDVVKVTDSLGNTKNVSVTVGAPASISPTSASVAPLGTASFAAAGGSGAGFTFTVSTNASAGSVNATTGAYKAGPTGSVTDVVTVTDSLGNSATASIAVSKAIALLPGTISVAPRGAASFSATGGAGGYTFSIQSNASGSNVAATSGAYTAGSKGGVSDVVRVTDTNGATATGTVVVGASLTVTPSPANAPPLGKIAFQASGGSGFGYVWELATSGSGGQLDTATGEYTAGETANTIDTVRVTDSLGNVALVGVSVGNAIAITPGTGAVPPLGGITFSATGGSGAGYAWTLEQNASGATLDAATGAYKAGSKGNVVDVVSVTDEVGGKTTATVEVSAGITISPETATVSAGDTVTFSVRGGSGEGWAWSLDPGPSGGRVGADGIFVAGTRAGVDVVVVKDNLGNEARANVTVLGGTSSTPGGYGTPGGLGAAPTRPADDACGCRVVGAARGPWATGRLLPLGLLLGLLAARRRRAAPRT